MYWKVPGFSQPSPVDAILDREGFTLEELLDEDDVVQECKALNGRVISCMRERGNIEALLRYMLQPQRLDDLDKAQRYPLAACEVLCCESDAINNALLADGELMRLLFSLLDAPPPLDSRAAGYFARVVVLLLLRKGTELLAYLQGRGNELVEKLVGHVDTTSVADVLRHLVGAGDSAYLPSHGLSAWLADTPLVDLLLDRLTESYAPEARSNAADILTATAHTAPSPLASRLSEHAAVSALLEHALNPGRAALVPALDVAIALLEPHRAALRISPAVQLGHSGDDLAGASYCGTPSGSAAVLDAARNEAVAAVAQHLPRLVELLGSGAPGDGGGAAVLPASYGLLAPPLGRHRLKVVELLAALLRSGCDAGEEAVAGCRAMTACMSLFEAYPFHNAMHHHVAIVLTAAAASRSDATLSHLFDECKLLDWLVGLPRTHRPLPNAGCEETAAAKEPMRAGFLGHVTHIGRVIDGLSGHGGGRRRSGGDSDGGSSIDGPAATTGGEGGGGGEPQSAVAKYTSTHAGWARYVKETLRPQLLLEDTGSWACGRPVGMGLGGPESDVGEMEHGMDVEQIIGMQSLYQGFEDANEHGDDMDSGGGGRSSSGSGSSDDDDDEDDDAAGFVSAPEHSSEIDAEAVSGIDIGLLNMGPNGAVPEGMLLGPSPEDLIDEDSPSGGGEHDKPAGLEGQRGNDYGRAAVAGSGDGAEAAPKANAARVPKGSVPSDGAAPLAGALADVGAN